MKYAITIAIAVAVGYFGAGAYYKRARITAARQKYNSDYAKYGSLAAPGPLMSSAGNLGMGASPSVTRRYMRADLFS